jgi:hypothetical protein
VQPVNVDEIKRSIFEELRTLHRSHLVLDDVRLPLDQPVELRLNNRHIEFVARRIVVIIAVLPGIDAVNRQSAP